MTRTPDGRGRERRTDTILPSVLSAREHGCPPPRPDTLPPRRGGRPSSKTASAAGRPASFAGLADARHGLFRSARALAASALLALSGALAPPAAAQDRVLVSDLGHPPDIEDGYASGAELSSHRDTPAQPFHVGADQGNYTLTSVEIPFLSAGIAAADIEKLSVSIWYSDSWDYELVNNELFTNVGFVGCPWPCQPVPLGYQLYTLENPPSIPDPPSTAEATTATFTAPEGAPLLAGKTYAVVVSYDKRKRFREVAPYWQTLETIVRVDAASAEGWDIPNENWCSPMVQPLCANASDATWGTADSNVHRLGVNGYVGSRFADDNVCPNPLSPPVDLRAYPTLPRQIHLGWWSPDTTHGARNRPVCYDYQYRYRVRDANTWTGWETVAEEFLSSPYPSDEIRNFNSREVTGLFSGETYEFEVRTVRGGPYSESVSILATAAGTRRISIEAASGPVTEGEPVRFTVSRHEPFGRANGRLSVFVTVSETGEMIERGRNWNYRNVEFADGQTTAELVLETVDDGDADEPDSEVTAKVRQSNSHPYGYLYEIDAGRGSATKTVTARSQTTRSTALSVADAEATEGEDATLDFVVRLDGNPGSDVTVDYRTRDGTAEAGSDYTETSGTLTFAPGENEKTVSVPITDDDEEDDGETFTLVLSNALGAGVANDDYEAVGTIRNDETEAPSGGLTASFEDMPETHDGESGFRFRVAFSEDIGISFQALREDAFTVTGGRVTRGTRVDDRRDLFEMTVEPDGDGDVTIELAAGRECATSGAICTKGENRQQLTNSPSATVAGPAGGSGPPELTAEFRDMPETHDGESAFTFRVAFSEDIGISFRALREDAFTVTGGRATRGTRVDDRRDLFEMTVEPDSGGDVTIELAAGRECATSGAICTKGENRRQLTNSPSATVKGPAASSAAAAPGWPDRAARLCSALAAGDGLTPAGAAAALWGDGDPGKDRLDALDSLGNENGRYDLGDMLAWAARCREGEASGPAAGSGPPSPPPALPASGPAGGASWRRKRARGTGRHRRPVPDEPADPRSVKTPRSGWLRLALLVAVTSVWGCGDGIVDPRNDAPRYDGANAAAVDPGPLHVRLTAPPQARDIGAMLVVEGPAIDSLQAPGLEMFETEESSSTRREVIIAGALPDAPVLRVWVPHRGDEARYRVRLLQVAGEDFALRDLSVYGSVISR